MYLPPPHTGRTVPQAPVPLRGRHLLSCTCSGSQTGWTARPRHTAALCEQNQIQEDSIPVRSVPSAC